jgi:hypothetical protein
MKRILLLVGVALGVIVGLSGVAWGAGQVLGGKRTETHTIADPVRSVVLDLDAGDVELVPGSGPVSVRDTRRWGLRKPHVKRTVRDGVLTVKASCPGGWFSRCSTDLRVVIPADVPVRVRGAVGDVTGRGLDTSRADIEVNVGDVDVTLAQSPADLRAETNVGDVHVTVPRGIYAVTASTDVGDEDVADLIDDGRAPNRIAAKTNVGDASVSGR